MLTVYDLIARLSRYPATSAVVVFDPETVRVVPAISVSRCPEGVEIKAIDPDPDTSVLDSMRAIVEYDWQKERDDYQEQDDDGRRDHVFMHLRVVDEFLKVRGL